jgi:hypothetical protein
MTNEKAIFPFYKELNNKVQLEEFIIDKSGVKVVELMAPRMILNPQQKYLNFVGRKSPIKYIAQEDEWYMSHELKKC